MTKKSLKEFERLLLEERKKIINKLAADKDKYGDLQRNEIGDIIDKAYSMWELDRTIDIAENDKQMLLQIDAAIQRLKTGAYGVCSCGKDINEERLQILPWSLKCIDCVNKKNKRG